MATDIVARALAASSTASTRNLATKVGSIGVRFFGGRVFRPYTVTTTGVTFEVMMTTALDFDAIRVIYAAGNYTPTANASSPNMLGAIAVLPDPTDASILAASWKNITYGAPASANFMGGSTTGTLVAGVTTDRRGYTISDLIPISSIPRTDGGKYPLLLTRALLTPVDSNPAPVVLSGTSSSDYSNWGTHPSGRIWRQLYRNGLWLNTQTMNQSNQGSPIAGIIYYARGKVVNIAGFGDSITEGVGGTYRGEGFGFPACLALTASDRNGLVYEWSDFGWEGQNMSAILNNLTDAVNLGLPLDVGIMPAYTPNEIGTVYSGVAAISGTLLTVTTAPTGTLAVGQYVYLPGITPGTTITALGTGTGGLGSYTVSSSQTVGSGTLMATNPITAALINGLRWKTSLMYNKLIGSGVSPIVWTGLATNDAQKTFGPTDSLRRSLNDDWRSRGGKGAVVADADVALAGADNGAGQVQYKAGVTTDNIHPNDTGNGLLSSVIQRTISRIVQPTAGGLIS
jgi:hypothetical protein